MICYQPGSSWFYRLHPLMKGGVTIGGILLLSLHGHPWWVSVGGMLAVLALFFTSRAPIGPTGQALRGILPLLMFVAVANLWQGSAHAHWRVVDSLTRIIGVFLLSGLFVTTSSQAELMAFWEASFAPLRVFGISTRELALVLVIAVRFLPVIMGEMERIRLAQMARGASFAGKGLMGRVRQLMPLLVPTLVLSIHRAGDLALAMEARGYRVHGERTRYRVFHFGLADILVAGGLLLLVVLISIP